MYQNRHKLQCEDAQRHTNNDCEDPKRDIELCLEVEMDDEVRDIITSPDMCASTLLDVTVIKPKDIDQIYTAHKKTLNGEDVRKLITSMELEKDDQKKLLDKILGDYSKKKNFTSFDKRPANSPIHCLNSQESALFYEHLQKISSTDETVSEGVSTYQQIYRNLQSAGDRERVEQIYTTPRTYNDLKALFTCKNKHKCDQNDKLNKPCLCQNCAILGLLNDAQKKPFATENCFDPRDHNRKQCNDKPKRKKSVNFRNEIHADCEYYFRYLSSKIKALEERLAVQEEKSVSREYFKKIVTKLINHISRLSNHSNQDSSRSQKCKETHKKDKTYDDVGRRYYVHPVLVDQNKCSNDKKVDKSKLNMSTGPPRLNSGIPPPQTHSDSFWKWGEEILRPGIDLKNKIIDLLEETLSNLRRPKESISRMEGNIKHFVDEFSNKLYKTINEVPVRDGPPKKPEVSKCSYDPNRSRSSSSISKKVDSNQKHFDKKTFRKIGPKVKKDGFFEEPLNVSYLNPKIRGWHEESQISFKFESSDMESVKNVDDRKLNECFKQDFMETLYHTKETDKLKLWQSIWNQAKTNGQSKQDKVTIQIPNRKDLQKHNVIEIEYTIAELEALLTSKASLAHKNDSCHKKK